MENLSFREFVMLYRFGIVIEKDNIEQNNIVIEDK